MTSKTTIHKNKRFIKSDWRLEEHRPKIEDKIDNEQLLKHLEGHKRFLEIDGRNIISSETTFLPRKKHFLTGKMCEQDGQKGLLVRELELCTNEIKSVAIFGNQYSKSISNKQEHDRDNTIFKFFQNALIEINTQIGKTETHILSNEEFDELIYTIQNINWDNKNSNKYVF